MRKKINILLSVFLLSSTISDACTVWGAFNSNELLIAKNRDFYPGNQKYRAMHNKGKYSFFGLYGDNKYDNKYNIKMGINETGLTLLMTFASSIPKKDRKGKIPYYNVMEKILGNYDSVDSITKDSNKLFNDTTPISYIIADRNKAVICEIGLQNNFKCSPYERRNDNKITTFAQTNHYSIKDLEQYNIKPKIDQQTSYFRFAKINELMNDNIDSLTFKKFIEFSLNTQAVNDTPPSEADKGFNNTYQDNSIFRTFNSHPDRHDLSEKNSDQDVSTIVVRLPKDKNKPVELYLRIINSMTDISDSKFTQQIKYTEATTTLANALNHPHSIKYTEKTCVRDVNSQSCVVK